MLSLKAAAAAQPAAPKYSGLLQELTDKFAVEFSVWDGTTGDLIHASSGQPAGDQLAIATMVVAVADRKRAEFIIDLDGVLALAVPVLSDDATKTVATAWFTTRHIDSDESFTKLSAGLSMSVADTMQWVRWQEVWSAKALLQLAEAVIASPCLDLPKKQELTARQQHEVEHYAHRKQITKIDFERYNDRSRFGPWNEQWTLFNSVREAYKNPDQRLLVFGCGRGQRALMYAKMGYTVYGFDIAPNQIENAQELARKYGLENRTHFSAGPAESLDYEDDFFDIIAGVNILHHVDLQQAVPEIQRVLKPGGKAYIADSLATPRRDALRNSSLVTWLIPKADCGTEDEHPLNTEEMATIRQTFPGMDVKRFRVVAVLAKALGMAIHRGRKKRIGRPFLEKVDYALFRVFPFLRRLGDQIVLTLETK